MDCYGVGWICEFVDFDSRISSLGWVDFVDAVDFVILFVEFGAECAGNVCF